MHHIAAPPGRGKKGKKGQSGAAAAAAAAAAAEAERQEELRGQEQVVHQVCAYACVCACFSGLSS